MKKLHYSLIALLIAGSFGASWVVYDHRDAWLPEKVPVHWGASFEPDRWASRDDMFWYLFAVPIGMLAMALILGALINWFSPRGFEATKANPSLSSYVILLVVGLCAALHAVILMGYITQKMPVETGIMGVIFLFFMLLGNILGKIQRNFWIGIRTPWTIASQKVWEKTHRLGAWLFVCAGTLGLLSLFLRNVLPLPVLLGLWGGLIGVAALVPVVYSYFCYKKLERNGQLDDVATA